jgi:hypothetical protein
MTEADALRNTFTAIQGLRALRNGAPREIALIDGEATWTLVQFGCWSKSAIYNNTQPVFLILQDTLPDEAVQAAQGVQHGDELWTITSRVSPAEHNKAYWLLSVANEEPHGRRTETRRERSEAEKRSDVRTVHDSPQSGVQRSGVSTW